MSMTKDTQDAPLDPRAMLDIIESESRDRAQKSTRPVPIFYLSWGAAWLIGYLLVWSSWPGSGSPILVPEPIAWVAFAALMMTAAAISAVVGIRMNLGIRGSSQWVGAIYGWSWTILGTGVAALGIALINAGLPTELAMLYFPSAYAFIVAALYLAGAMMWRSIDQLVIAVIFVVTGSVAPFFGAPANLLTMAVVGGGAMLVGGLVAVFANRRR
jgi:hypothetical protein